MELLQDIGTKGLGSLQWGPEPVRWEPLPGGGIRVVTPARVDYFRDPDGRHVTDSAPFLWLQVEGDFVAQAHVRPTFASVYDAGALMVRHDETHWAKSCFESTDFGTHAAVSVVTNGLSDDANGVNLDVAALWMQIVRVGNVFAMHYALDGQNWRMTRYFTLPVPPAIRVGMVSQSPTGPGATIDWLAFRVERRAVANLRAGI
jgi:regulation of enolase protein 1 (concanavalin A-like superfamily)